MLNNSSKQLVFQSHCGVVLSQITKTSVGLNLPEVTNRARVEFNTGTVFVLLNSQQVH